jgi:predicted DNA-binding transcriptional regulator AlpA
MVSAGRAPAPLRLSRGCVRWRRAELIAWTEAGCPDRRTWELLGDGPAQRDGRG